MFQGCNQLEEALDISNIYLNPSKIINKGNIFKGCDKLNKIEEAIKELKIQKFEEEQNIEKLRSLKLIEEQKLDELKMNGLDEEEKLKKLKEEIKGEENKRINEQTKLEELKNLKLMIRLKIIFFN